MLAFTFQEKYKHYSDIYIFHPISHPFLNQPNPVPLMAVECVSLYVQSICDTFEIGALRIYLSENAFAGHWKTVMDYT